MPVRENPQHPRALPPTPTPTPTPTYQQIERMRWVRVYVFPRSSRAHLRYVPLRTLRPGETRQDPTTRDLWSCRTSYVHVQVVRAKYAWEQTWEYFELRYSLPLIPGFGRSNRALLRLPHCPAFVGEVVVVRRAGYRLHEAMDVRLEDLRKIEVAVTSALRSAMGLDGTYRGGIDVEYMLSFEALDNLH
ncbi:hypothetical protein GSI_11970 [Ganoderma sinense ZZ0214-1]|uniref:Uncharacterized protein n=1 Tax=Ganoderma sinense ZZ0214-1 TaxID=1077348 RepID=A0A2G8RXH4_9APHY|nr:hypothetical protein GSI_11970 [Ganoderma sinense ZZ0214-1]